MPVHARCRTNTLTARQTGAACGQHCTGEKKPIKFLVRNKYAYFEMQRFAAELGYYQNIYDWLIGDKIGLIFLGNLPVKDSKI